MFRIYPMIQTRIEEKHLGYKLKYFALDEYSVFEDPRELKKF